MKNWIYFFRQSKRESVRQRGEEGKEDRILSMLNIGESGDLEVMAKPENKEIET